MSHRCLAIRRMDLVLLYEGEFLTLTPEGLNSWHFRYQYEDEQKTRKRSERAM